MITAYKIGFTVSILKKRKNPTFSILIIYNYQIKSIKNQLKKFLILTDT
jgi:hypothetical protein